MPLHTVIDTMVRPLVLLLLLRLVIKLVLFDRPLHSREILDMRRQIWVQSFQIRIKKMPGSGSCTLDHLSTVKGEGAKKV